MSNLEQRAELHKTIWAIADELRGSIEGWDFKQYVLGTLFYRYVSENFEIFINKSMGAEDIPFAQLKGSEISTKVKHEIVKEKGYWIDPEDLFCNVNTPEFLNNDELAVNLHNIFKKIERSAKGFNDEENLSEKESSVSDLSGLFNDFDTKNSRLGKSDKERSQRLAKVIEGVGNLNLSGNTDDHGIDLFGDAYEFLIGVLFRAVIMKINVVNSTSA